jgi:hypothetical protein
MALKASHAQEWTHVTPTHATDRDLASQTDNLTTAQDQEWTHVIQTHATDRDLASQTECLITAQMKTHATRILVTTKGHASTTMAHIIASAIPGTMDQIAKKNTTHANAIHVIMVDLATKLLVHGITNACAMADIMEITVKKAAPL